MKSLRTKFFVFFAGLGFLASLAVGLVMYVQYFRYIKYSYTDSLAKIAALTLKQYPIVSNPEYLIGIGKADDPEYWQFLNNVQLIAESFNLAYIYMIQKTPEGKYLFIFDTDDVDAESTEEFFDYYQEDEVPPELDAAYMTGHPQVSKPYTDEWGSFVSLFTPVFDSNNRIAGILGFDYDVSLVRELEQRANIALIIALATEILFSILIAGLVASSLIKPIKEIIKLGHTIAEMRFDIDIPIERKDEIGDIQRSLNTIRSALKKTLNEIKNEQTRQKNISETLGASIKDSSSGLEVITDSMESVQGKTNNQVQSVSRTSDSLEEIIGHIRSLENAVDTQGQNISQSSETIEQMVKDIDAVRDVVYRSHKSISGLSSSSDTGRKMLNNLNEELSHIVEQSSFLEEANAALVNIASQTNILAMNAVIEAAHAGEAGRGFAVVAGEVRKLAESSSKESASISKEIKNMRNAIEKIRQVSLETVNTMGSMFTEVTGMQGYFGDMMTAVNTLASNGTRILNALETLGGTMEQVKNSSVEIRRESDSIYGAVEDLKNISKDVQDSVRNVQEACLRIAGSLSDARNIADGEETRK
ncbi:MAG: methyl-accepting chemotaxis protein [Treponema sp.]|nr:methyl-accepting chemotaxis protein [Treponema sp.]